MKTLDSHSVEKYKQEMNYYGIVNAWKSLAQVEIKLGASVLPWSKIR